MIRDATAADWPAIWPIFAQIVGAADTFSYDPAMTEDESRELWMVPPPGRTSVAVDGDGTIVGTANMYANRPGPATTWPAATSWWRRSTAAGGWDAR